MRYIQQSKRRVKRATAWFLFILERLPLRLLLPLFIALITGCGGGDPVTQPSVAVLEIQALTLEPERLEIEDTASVRAAVNYSGNLNALGYDWTTSGGEILGTAARVTYVAPNKAGTYTIRLRVTDGRLSATAAISVEVTLGPAIVLQ